MDTEWLQLETNNNNVTKPDIKSENKAKLFQV